MNVFKIEKVVRPHGFNTGLPVISVTFGPGANLSPEELVSKLAMKGCRKNDWVLLKECNLERGIVTIIDGLKYIGVGVEVECSTSDTTPKFFMKVDKWTLIYKPNGLFGLGQLRPRQDIILCDPDNLPSMLKALQGYSHVDRGILINRKSWSIDEIWENKLRVYPGEI